MNAHPQNEIDFNYITDGIYIGTNQCCKVHFEERLIKEGITADISLEEERVDAPFGVAFYTWIPVKNHTAPTPDQLEFGVSVLEKLVAIGKKIYVHCKNGHGRAPTLVAAYLTRKGEGPEEAEAFIKSKRPSMHLQDAQRAALRDFSARGGSA
ncbi:MAG: dual specificity protein phosphatase family protein, partial [Candidatus Harrisonbacteria bacterium]|nr:dual specificity protein phosphatase family protein [Candidatus Harrisonbacteria bacterium]